MIEEKINKRIVLAGGPSTGKTSVIDALRKSQFLCFQEAAREILTDYKLNGSEFKTNPIGISNEIFKKRHEDYEKGENISCKENLIFYDRGIHEITAYLKSINKSTNYWDRLPENYKYDLIFIFQPWEEIYKKDENRIEEFSEAKKISPFIYKVYNNAGIKIIEVPNLSIQERVKFILNSL